MGVSGGPDSVLLAHIFHTLNLPFCIAHVNYRLRGNDSEADEQLVKKLAQKFKVKCFVYRAKKQELEKKGASLQMLARDLRYRFFEKVAQQEKTDYTVLAHHANDQVETVLLNFFRGCGLDGLTGMKVLDQKKFRPLLTVKKETIEAALKEKKIAFRLDRSNLEDDYKRNFLRNTILPKLEKKWPGIQQTVLDNVQRLDSAAKALASVKPKAIDFNQNFILDIKTLGTDAVFMDHFKKQMVQAGFDLKEIEKLLRNTSTETKKISGPRGQLEKKSGQLRFVTTVSTNKKPTLHKKGNRVSVDIPNLGCFKSLAEEIDATSIKGKLVLRPWQAGDKMMPLGMKGFKKVSDLLTDLKLPLSLKQQVYVLHDTEKIVWLVGFRIDERVKLKDSKPGGKRIFLSIN